MSTDLVHLTPAAIEPAAEAIRALLETEGIASIQRSVEYGGVWGSSNEAGSAFGPREILVRASTPPAH